MNKPLSRAIKKVQRKKITEQVPNTTTRRNVRSQKYRTKTGAFDQAAYDADKDAVVTKKGGGRPRKKGGPLATTKGSSVQKTGSSAMTTTNKNTGVTKAEPEAKDQTIDVKATRVNGEIEKSKVGSMPNSGKKEVDPKKNTSITKVGKQNDNSKTYSDNERKSQGFDDRKGRYSDTPRKNEQERQKKREKAKERLKNIRQIRKDKRTRLVKGVANAAVDTAKYVGKQAKRGISTTTKAFGTSSFTTERITFKDYLNKL